MRNKIFIVSAIVFVLDQIIKLLVYFNEVNIRLINNFLSISYTENTGVAFSMLSGKRWLIILVTIIILGVLIKMVKEERFGLKKNDFYDITYGLLFAGIFSNFVDRLFHGFVIDYISITMFGYSFPIFNIADIAIILGVILLNIYTLRNEKKDKKEKKITVK